MLDKPFSNRRANLLMWVVLVTATIFLTIFLLANSGSRVGPPYQTITGGGSSGSSIEAFAAGTSVVGTVVAIDCFDGTVVCADGGSGTLDISAVAVPTATPQPTATVQPQFPDPVTWNNTDDTVNAGLYALHCRKGRCQSSTAGAGLAGDWDELYAFPFYVHNGGNFDLIKIKVDVNGSAGEKARFGIYETDPDTREPTDLFYDFGAQPVDSGEIIIDPGATITVTDHTWYALAFITESVTAELNRFGNPEGPFYSWGKAESSDNREAWGVKDTTYTCNVGCTVGLPDPFTVSSYLNIVSPGNVPAMYMDIDS